MAKSRSSSKKSGSRSGSSRSKSGGGRSKSSGGRSAASRGGKTRSRTARTSATASRSAGARAKSGGGKSGGSRGGGSRGASSRGASVRGGAAGSQTTSDHDQIREWAEARGGKPACVRGTGGGGDAGLLRIDFPGYSGGESLQEITWDEFFQKFDEQNLALLYQETTKDGQRSNFNKLVDRKQAGGKSGRRK